MTSIALFAGMVFVVGVLLAFSGAQQRPVKNKELKRRRRDLKLPPPEHVAIIGAVAFAVLFITRWPVAAAGGALATGVLLSARAKRRERAGLAETAEAIAAWAEMLRDATGTPRGIEGVLVATAPNAPELIRPHVVALSRRLPYEPLDQALTGLLRDLDHPLGDLVVTALRLSGMTGGRQIRSVLNDLVIVAREEARMHMRVNVARARPRSQMRILTVMIGVFVAGMAVLAQDFLEPYRTPGGQIVLVVIGCIWAFSMWLMSRFGAEEQPERFLAIPEPGQ